MSEGPAPDETDADPGLDSGPGARRAGPARTCIVTRSVRPVAELIRFVLGPDGSVVPDLKNKLPGRGVWVTTSRETVRKAAERGAFARAFRRAVQMPADLAAVTENLLVRAVLDALGMAHKAGLVAPGFVKAEAALESGGAIGLVQAAEAAADGVRKLAAAARRAGLAAAGNDTDGLPVVILPQEQLDLALGRANVIHAALLAGPASEALLARFRRLEAFQGGEPAKLAAKCG